MWVWYIDFLTTHDFNDFSRFFSDDGFFLELLLISEVAKDAKLTFFDGCWGKCSCRTHYHFFGGGYSPSILYQYYFCFY